MVVIVLYLRYYVNLYRHKFTITSCTSQLYTLYNALLSRVKNDPSKNVRDILGRCSIFYTVRLDHVKLWSFFPLNYMLCSRLPAVSLALSRKETAPGFSSNNGLLPQQLKRYYDLFTYDLASEIQAHFTNQTRVLCI